MRVRQAVQAVVVVVTLAATGGACAPAAGPPTEVDVALAVAADGSLQVQETIRVSIEQPITTFRRTSPAFHHDGLSDIRATLDGAGVPQGAGTGHVQIAAQDHLDVTWTFPQMSGQHTFGLVYRAANVVRVSGIRGRVSWLAMPPHRGSNIGRMNVALVLPEDVVQLDDPWVMEAGWAVTREPRGMRATRTNVPSRDGVHVGAEFTIDTLKLAQPAWQYHEDRAEEFKLAFLSAGAFLLVVAGGIIGMIRVRLAAIEPGPLRDLERLATARGLRITAVVTIMTGALGWFLVRATLGTFGPWPYALPVCTLLSGVAFRVDAWLLARRRV